MKKNHLRLYNIIFRRNVNLMAHIYYICIPNRPLNRVGGWGGGLTPPPHQTDCAVLTFKDLKKKPFTCNEYHGEICSAN